MLMPTMFSEAFKVREFEPEPGEFFGGIIDCQSKGTHSGVQGTTTQNKTRKGIELQPIKVCRKFWEW